MKESNLTRTTSDDAEFRELVRYLDQYLQIVDGEDHAFYDQYNQLDKINHVVVAYRDGVAVGCGAIKPLQDDIMEVKRMFVLPEYRGRGIAWAVLSELETWAHELNYAFCVLETGLKQTEAIRLYQKSGYVVIPNYGQYVGVENSICMQKAIHRAT